MLDTLTNLVNIGAYTVVALVAIGIIYLVIRSRWKIAGPNEALIIYGARQKKTADTGELLDGARIVVGGGAFVLPAWQQYARMPLEIMTLDVNLSEVNTKQAIPVRVRGVAQVKVAGDVESIRRAAQGFLSASDEDIQAALRETLAGHLRGVVGTLTVEELNFEREAFQNSVRAQAEDDLAGMGFEIKSFVIQEIEDTRNYMESIGAPKVAEAEKNARIAKAEADKEAALREEAARQVKATKAIEVDTALAEAEKVRDLKKAEIQKEVDVEKARAAKAGEFALVEENIRIAEREAERREKELAAEVIKQAEAQAQATRIAAEAALYEQQQSAEAALYKAAKEAEAQLEREKARTEAIRLQGAAEADARRAQAEAIKEVGVAEAEAIGAKGKAEADALRAHAEALGLYDEAGLALESLKVLPEIAAAIAEPLSRAGQTTIISSGDGEGTGAVKMAQDGVQILQVVSDITGVDTKTLLAGLAERVKKLNPGEAGTGGEA